MIDIPANWMEKVQNIDWSKVKASVKDYGPAIKVLQQTWSKESLLEISQGKLFVPDSVINEAIAKKMEELDFFASIKRMDYDEAVEKGGRASLKSSYVSVEVVLQLLRHPDCHALVTRQVADTMRDSVYAP